MSASVPRRSSLHRLASNRVARTCATVAGCVALISLLGWLGGLTQFTTFLPGWPTMKFGTTLSILAISSAIILALQERDPRWRRSRPALRRTGIALTLLPLLYSGLVLAEYLSGHDLLFVPSQTSAGTLLTRPSPATAIALLLSGLCLITWRHPRWLTLLSILAGGVGIMAWLGLSGLIYDRFELAQTGFFSTLSLPTALALFAISAGVFALRPMEGIARLFRSRGYAGQLARWLVPLGAVITLGLGSLQLWGHRYFQLSVPFGLAVYGTAMFIALTLLGLRGAWLVDRIDLRRRRAERQRAAEREEAYRLLQESETRRAQSEQRFRGIFDSTFQFIGLLTPDGRVVEANQTALRMIGARLEDVQGKPFIDTPWWSHSEVEQAKLREALARSAAGEVVRFETSHPDASGELHYVDFSIKPVTDASGRIVHFVPEGRDITERKRAEESLGANEELLRQFIKHTPAAIAMLDKDLRYVQTSDRWLKDYHLDGQTIIGRTHYDVFPDIPQRWKDIHQRVLAGAVEYCDEDPFPRDDGGTEWLQWEARPWRKVGGEIGGLVFYTQVITSRKIAEAQLRDSEERFRGAFENSAVGMALVSLEGRWLRVNRALCATVGRTEEELLACVFQDITHPDDLDADLEHVRSLLAGESDYYQMEKRYLHKSGRIVWVLLSVTLLRDGQGRPLHFVTQIKDITERHDANVKLQESLNEKEVLLREIHHRVKNNMQVITSLLQLQADYLHDARDAVIFRECQERIHAMSLVHDHLYRSGNLGTINFSDYLRELASLIIRGHNRTSKRIQLGVEGEPIEMNLDIAIPLGLITAELISNAYKHAFTDRPEGVITVRLTREAELRASVSVEDNGVGMPENFQVAKARSLGLRLIHALARQLRADFSVAGSGAGAKMKVSLPIQASQNL